MTKESQNKVAIVTGGGTGIGRATSLLLASLGVTVMVVYSHSQEDADDTVNKIKAAGGKATAFKTNVAVNDEVVHMTELVADTFGRIDYLVNNAGITRQLPFTELDQITDEIWDELYAVNVKGAFNCARAAARHLKKNPGSSIVNIGSIAGETGYGSSLPYATSKAAMHGLTRSLARALSPDIRVNCIAPGAVQTRWWAGHEEKMHALTGAVALQRVSMPADIAESVVMLLTAASVTGQIIRADNGQTL